jgi:hypothetical protein
MLVESVVRMDLRKLIFIFCCIREWVVKVELYTGACEFCGVAKVFVVSSK